MPRASTARRELRIYWSIVVPGILPILATLAIWTFLATWNDFMWPLIVLSDESQYTLPVALANLSGEHVQDTELMMAGSVLTVHAGDARVPVPPAVLHPGRDGGEREGMRRVRHLPLVTAVRTGHRRAPRLRADDLGVERALVLGVRCWRLVVDVDDAEALRVPEAPLEVVEQRPGEVAAQVDALLRSRRATARRCVAQVVDAQRIVDAAVARRRRIVEGGAVLGDVERRCRRSAPSPRRAMSVRPGGIDLPAGLGVGRAAAAARGAARSGQASRIVPRDAARVVVDAEEVDRLADERRSRRRASPATPRRRSPRSSAG